MTRSHHDNAISMLIHSSTAESREHFGEATRASMSALTYSNLELADALRELRGSLLDLGRAEWRARHPVDESGRRSA